MEPKSVDSPTGKAPIVRLHTTDGDILLELFSEVAPRHVENFLRLVQECFYDGLTFHRVVPGFIIQSGCPHGDGTAGPGYKLEAEFSDRPHGPGTLSMARTQDPNSAGSQFFICLDRDNCRHLDGEYTVFGQVVEGMEVVEAIAASPLVHPELGTPEDPPSIMHAWDESENDDSDSSSDGSVDHTEVASAGSEESDAPPAA
ncbi:MAG: peptidylprolyl isomerase [Phycisphaerae bacterium]|nr:peptidylprolyl isomerase [Phycisphaerae bacterium]